MWILKVERKCTYISKDICLPQNRQTKTASSWVVSSREVTKLERFNDMEGSEVELKEYMKKSFVIKWDLK